MQSTLYTYAISAFENRYQQMALPNSVCVTRILLVRFLQCSRVYIDNTIAYDIDPCNATIWRFRHVPNFALLDSIVNLLDVLFL